MDIAEKKFWSNVCLRVTACAVLSLTGAVAFAGEDILNCVNTLIGTESRRKDTSNSAGMVPAVCVPFGGVKWVPMTRLTEVGRVSYLASDQSFLGFIGTRQPSPWMGDFGQFSVMARLGDTDCDYATRGYPFDRSKCVFTPYYCRIVDAKGIISEVTASSHAAWIRFTFPKGGRRHLVLDASRRFEWTHSDKSPFPGGVTFGEDRRTVRLWNSDRPDAHFGPPLANWRSDVRIDFSETPVRCGTYVEGKPPVEGLTVSADQCGGWVEFAPDVDVVTLRIGTSTVGDPEGVVRRELGDDGFDATREKARARWAEKLSVVDVDADDDVRRVFATAVYHALMYPAEFSEGGRYYSGFDDRIHEGSSYTSFSLWDTYRAEHPFLTIFAPERVDGMVRSLLQMYREGGYLPKWPNLSYTGIMVGGPAEIVIAEAVRKGFRGFDLGLAYEAVKKNATVPTPNDGTHDWPSRGHWSGYPETRGGLTTYQALGYVACDRTDESVSRTQDFGHDDLAAAVLADAVGRPDEAARFRARSRNYTNLWNAAKGTFWPKRTDGTWAETASPREPHPAYTEQFWQTAVWGVPYDVPGLMGLIGGRDVMERRLDDYFGNYFYRNQGGKMSHHENEPSHHVAYLYAAIGLHDKCARQVRRILTSCYAPDEWGMEGNDDCGQMSAWYVFSALGFYPLDPTSGDYVIGSPLVRKAVLRIGAPYKPATFTVIAHNQAKENYVVKSVKLNGVELPDRRIRHTDIVKGGTLEFEMAAPDEWRPKERWRGFNLHGLAIKGAFEGKIEESDFAMIRELGFNFVRLPIDYRYFCDDGDPMVPDPRKLERLDKIIGWGRKHGVHVNLSYTTFPGMQLSPRSKGPLFNDPAVRRHLARNWRILAKRYRDIPNDELTFNLFNEPDGTATEAEYVKIVDLCAAEIHAEDPDRFIVVDGLNGRDPVPGVVGRRLVGQSHHAYVPSGVTHYRASWIQETPNWIDPHWPPAVMSCPLHGKAHPPSTRGRIVIHDVPDCVFGIDPVLVKREAELVVEADGVEILRRRYRPHPGEPGWTNMVRRADGHYAATPLEPIRCAVPKCRRLSVGLDDGEWMTFHALTFEADGKTLRVPADFDWGRPEDDRRHRLRFNGFDRPMTFADGTLPTGESYLREATWDKWRDVLTAGQFVAVGEFGAFNQTPHAITLSWMEDNLKIWKDLGIGWAMWNFRGEMGILDSNRADADYVDFHGHKLDRKMYELLKRY